VWEGPGTWCNCLQMIADHSCVYVRFAFPCSYSSNVLILFISFHFFELFSRVPERTPIRLFACSGDVYPFAEQIFLQKKTPKRRCSLLSHIFSFFRSVSEQAEILSSESSSVEREWPSRFGFIFA